HFARALPILSPAPTLEAVSQPSVWQSVMSGGCCKLITGRPTAPFEKEETVSLRWLGSNTRASALPTPHTLVRAVYIGRACIAVAIYLAAALKFKVAAPLDILVTSFVLVATAVVTIASYWHTPARGVRHGGGRHGLRREPRQADGGRARGAGGGAASGPARGGGCVAQHPDGDRDGGPGGAPAVHQSCG